MALFTSSLALGVHFAFHPSLVQDMPPLIDGSLDSTRLLAWPWLDVQFQTNYCCFVLFPGFLGSTEKKA